MSKVRILFLGTPEFARLSLKALIEDEHYDIVGVVTQPDRPAGRNMKLTPSPVKVFAQSLGLRVWSPESAKDPTFLSEITELSAECAVVVAYGQILKKEFLQAFPFGCVNVHASLLPRWRGAAPIQRAIMSGDKESGVCLQVMVAKLDAGAVLGSRRISISDSMTATELHDQLAILSGELLRVELMDYIRGNLTPVPQDETQVTYAKKIEKSEAQIDWRRSAEEIHNLIRGLSSGPYAFGIIEDKALKLHRTEISNLKLSAGEVEVREGNLYVGCGKGSLRILELQPESRAKMNVQEFLRGHPLKSGSKFKTEAK